MTMFPATFPKSINAQTAAAMKPGEGMLDVRLPQSPIVDTRSTKRACHALLKPMAQLNVGWDCHYRYDTFAVYANMSPLPRDIRVLITVNVVTGRTTHALFGRVDTKTLTAREVTTISRAVTEAEALATQIVTTK